MFVLLSTNQISAFAEHVTWQIKFIKERFFFFNSYMYFFQSYKYEDTIMNLELKPDLETCTTKDNFIEICESNDPIK